MNHRIKRIISVTQRPFISRGRPSCLTSVLFALMFAIMCLWFYWRIYIVLPPNRQPRTYDHCEGSSDSSPPIEAQTAIHLGMVLRGSRTVLRALTMLKSVFYYQGRLRDNSADCDLVLRTPHRTCPLRTDLRQTFPIHVHFICDNETSLLLSTSLTDWKLPGFSWTIYDLYKYTPNVAWILNSHNAGTAATVKLVIPCVLPRWVEKIIVVDSDMLLNANLQDLWQQFDLFDRHQAIAMAAEQRSDSSRCDGQPAGSITGINGGLSLLHLAKLRANDWDQFWRSTVRDRLYERWYLIEGEQEIFSAMITSKPEIHRPLPCEWNVQLYTQTATVCCPVFWPDRDPDETECSIFTYQNGVRTQINLLKMAHFNTSPKPEDDGVSAIGWYGNVSANRSLTVPELKIRFMERYYQFKAIPIHCFH